MASYAILNIVIFKISRLSNSLDWSEDIEKEMKLFKFEIMIRSFDDDYVASSDSYINLFLF